MQGEKPFFSIVTVVKDDVEGLRVTLSSVCAQSIVGADLDCVVIDGGSLPEVRACVQSCVGEKNAHALRHICGSDSGIYDAMNAGIAHARGAWILFLNTGDVFCNETTLVRVRAAMERGGVVAGGGTDYAYVAAAFYENLRGRLVPKEVISPQRLPCAMPTSHQALFIRRDLALQHVFDLRYKVCADAHQMARVLKTGKGVFVCDERIVTVQAQGYSTDNFALMMRERWRIRRELYPGMRHFVRVSAFVFWQYCKRYARVIMPKGIQDAMRVLKYKGVGDEGSAFSVVNALDVGPSHAAPAKGRKKLLWITTVLDESAVSKIFFLLAPYIQEKYCIAFISIEPIRSEAAARTLSEMGVALLSLECSKWRVVQAAKKLARSLEKDTPDIIHAHLGRAYIVACAAHKRVTWRGAAATLLATFHNRFGYFSPLTRLALKNMFPHFHGVSAVSQDCLHSYARLLHKDALKHVRSAVLYNPVEYVRICKNSYEHEVGVSPVVFCASRLCAGKGHVHVLRMMVKLCEVYPNARLYLAGEGPLRRKLQGLVRNLGLAERVHFLGHIQNVYAYMKYADVVVFPSEGEGFGLVPCEAFLQETPVIMEDTATARELFVSDVWYVSCKDAEAFCARVRDVVEHKAQYGAHVVREKDAIMQRFSPKNIAQQYLAWFEAMEAYAQ